MSKTYLNFYGYEVKKMLFEVHDDIKKGEEYQISHKIDVGVEHLESKFYNVKIDFNLCPANDEIPVPFDLSVTVVGKFELVMDETEPGYEKTKETLLSQNAPAILFPYLRCVVSNLTLNANISPLILPIVNFSEDK